MSSTLHYIPVIGQLIYAYEEGAAWYDARNDRTKPLQTLADRIKPLDDLANGQVGPAGLNLACAVVGFCFARALQWSGLGLALLAVSAGTFFAVVALRHFTVQRLHSTRMEIMRRAQANVPELWANLKRQYPEFLVNLAELQTPIWHKENPDERQRFGFTGAVSNLFSQQEFAMVEKVWQTREENAKRLNKRTDSQYDAYWDLQLAHTQIRWAANRDDVSKFKEAVENFEQKLTAFQSQDYSRVGAPSKPASAAPALLIQTPSPVGKLVQDRPVLHIDIAARKQAFEARFYEKFGDASHLQFPCQILVSVNIVHSVDKVATKGVHTYCENQAWFRTRFREASNAVFNSLTGISHIEVLETGAYVIAKSPVQEGFRVETITSRIGELYKVTFTGYLVLGHADLDGGEIYNRLPETSRTLTVKNREAFRQTDQERSQDDFFTDYDKLVHWNTHRYFMAAALKDFDDFGCIIDDQGNLISTRSC